MDTKKYLEESIDINEARLNDEFIKMPAAIAYWANEHANKVADYQHAKLNKDQTYARLFTKYHAKLLDEKERPTEKKVDAAIELDHEMYQAQVALLTAEREKNHVAGIMEAVRTKRDMLVSLGANYRAELQGDPSLRALAQNQRIGRENT